MSDIRARVVTHGPGVYEMWCDEHSTVADPETGFAPQAAMTPDAAYAQRRVDSHNAKWHAEAAQEEER